jgi:hypothetical protein
MIIIDTKSDLLKKPVYDTNIKNKEQLFSFKDKLLIALFFSNLKKYGYPA